MSQAITYCSRCGKRNDIGFFPPNAQPTPIDCCVCPPESKPIPGVGGIAFVHEYDPSRELVMIPKGASIFPLIDNEALWQIAQEVAEEDVTYYDDVQAYQMCRFCDGATRDLIHEFPHTTDCIVTKARELIKQRKQMPQITVKLAVDGKTKEAGV